MPKLPTRSHVLSWLDENILLVLASFLLAFIPLWPKKPLFDLIEQYIVRGRLEDVFIVLAALIWLVQFIRKKVTWHKPMAILIILYAIVGLSSTLMALFVLKTVPLEPLHVGKTLLHYFRYLEYFSLFFILFSAIKKKSHVVLSLAIITLTVFSISIYGYGQKYMHWPVYSTMNREYSKGLRLTLSEHARVQSTFGGHYDMGGYLVVTLPLILALIYSTSNKKLRFGLYVVFTLGSWLLILSASRTPFVAFLVGVVLVIGLTALQKSKITKKLAFFTKQAVLNFTLIALLFYYFGTGLSERLTFFIEGNPMIEEFVESFQEKRRQLISDDLLSKFTLSPEKLRGFLPKKEAPPDAITTDDVAAIIQANKEKEEESNTVSLIKAPVEPTQPTQLPPDVYVEVPEKIIEVKETTPTGETITKQVAKKRVYSDCALKKELSLCIRQEVLWPRAIEGFYANPILGTGYATLTKEAVEQFTEADSTDNNYLRTLGEIGILGFISFYGSVLYVLFTAAKNIRNSDKLAAAMSVGVFAGSVGILLNALYIDVFAASKIALSYWALSGLFLGYIFHLKFHATNKQTNTKKLTKKNKKSSKTRKSK